jgi:ribosomal protein S18 acetylase RimI-like enzyme
MDHDSWLQLNLRGMQAAFSSFARSAGAELLERDGVIAVVNPAVPERSVFNSVVYLDHEALVASYDELAAAYAEAGCSWTIWAPESDGATAEMLDRAGHTLDAKPRAMGIDLAAVTEPDLSDLDWTDQGDADEMSLLNDAAYGYEPGTWVRGMGRRAEGLNVYVARADGKPAATVCSRDADGDCAIWMVATAEWARGRGLSTALMRKAIFDGAQRGCRTSTLQATKLGAPVYRRIGYQDLGALGMWEMRPPELADHAAPGPPA